jgi:hypothetical protein
MKVQVDIESGDKLVAALKDLLEEEQHLEYANFKPLAEAPGSAALLHLERWTAQEAPLAALVARDAAGRPLAALRLKDRPFESAHFDRKMATCALPVCRRDPDSRVAGLRALYPAAWQALASRGYDHVALRISTRDRESLWAAQEAGAIYVDTQVSWMAPLTGVPHDESPPGTLTFEAYEGRDVAELPRESWTRLAAWGAQAFDRGPLVFDLGLPVDRAKSVYEVWTERVMTGEWADATLVVRDAGEVVAFISMLELPDVSRLAKSKVCGRGLGATLPDYRGLFTLIQREMIARRPLGAAYMENETQVATIGSINVYAKLGFRYLRSTCTLHRDLSGGGTSCA